MTLGMWQPLPRHPFQSSTVDKKPLHRQNT